MLKKRIVGVITVKKGWAVQSIGYQRYLPLGRPETIAENLDRWGVDEILIQSIDRSTANQGPDYDLIYRLASRGLNTPLVYGGGIKTREHATAVISKGADRILVDASFYDHPEEIRRMASVLGAQAVIASVPLLFTNSGIALWDYRTQRSRGWPSACAGLLTDSIVSEILVIDKSHEGTPASFDISFLETPFLRGSSLIAFGGINKPCQIKDILDMPDVTAVAIGNFLNYREHAVQELKHSLPKGSIREPYYELLHS